MSYSREEVKAITDKILNMAKADGVEVEFQGGERSATRYANSSITANLIEHDQQVQITVYYGQKSASTVTHQFDDASLTTAIDEAQALARRKPDNPEAMPLVKPPQTYVPVEAVMDRTVDFGPAERAAMVKQSLDLCEKKGVVGAGYIPKLHWTQATANSEGLFSYFRFAEASFILTCRTPDGTGSGWAGQTGLKDVSQIDPVAITETAADKALKSQKPRAIEPGDYTVILESRPAARFLSLLLSSMDARAAEEGRSFMSGPERGSTKVGQKLFGDNVTIRSVINDPTLRQSPVGEDGLAAQDVTWVEKGVVKNLYYSRYWGQKQGKPATGTNPGQSVVMDGGTMSVEEMIKSTKRGLLVSFFWYMRPVEAMSILYTGMTRDGLFLIENGEVTTPVQNFRWNESPVVGLNNITALGPAQPMHTGEAYDQPGTAMIPAMRIEDFTMTSVSPAV
ncbi:MAG: TldD/PmbA family protein [Acidobacteria bacterium]|nr:TldD/PmbA family protein [Acidobacteriota bacterium]